MLLPYKALDSLKIEDGLVRAWAEGLSPGTALNYGYYLLRYLRWARRRGYWASAREMVEEYRRLGEEGRYRHLDILKEFLRSTGTGSRDRKNCWFAVKSFYEHNRLPFPKLPRGEASRLFRPSEDDKRRAVELGPLRPEDVRSVVMNAPQPYKAAIMVMFQAALGRSEFTQFNLMGWKRILGELERPGPVRIDLYREKTSGEAVRRYYTFMGEDAKALVKEWLSMRPKAGPEALFLVYNKNKREWVPLMGLRVSDAITRIAKRIGLARPSGLRRYSIHAHELRDLFKSLCTLSGVSPIASEFFLGHTIDKLGYDKSPQYDEDWFRREYAKVEPRLNVLSNPLGLSVEERVEEARKQAALEAMRRFAEAFGIDPMRVRIEKRRELGREPDAEEELQAIQNEIRKLRVGDSRGGGADPKKVVAEDELEAYMAEGWDVQLVLPSGKVVIRKAC